MPSPERVDTMQVAHNERRLAAILAIDMVGYSRLMEIDEGGTVARLRAHRIELIDPVIAKCHGDIVNTTGDGLLVEFHSVVDALRCAIEIQNRMARRNADLDEARRIEFRIGINLGDIIIDGDEIFGDGINVAARLEALAEPGGICVSRSVRDQVSDGLDVAFEDIGEKAVKNISRPVHAYMVVPGAEQPRGGARAAGESGAKPAIAVLPFSNMSGEDDQGYFADGLTEDIITELSRRRELFVISRNSSFVYKGQAVNIREVAAKLGAQYIVEGSVRKAGERVRVTVQLIDTASDRHIWAERYDRELADIFAIQDQVTASIVATLPGRLEADQQEQASRKTPANLAAYECVLAGKIHHHRSTREDNATALALLDRAIAMDPNYAHAHAWKACVTGQKWIYGWCEDVDEAWETVTSELETALALDDNDADVHRILAAVNVTKNDHARAQYHQERALALNPNYDLSVVQQGEILTWLGRPEEGIEWIGRAMRLNPHHPERFWSHLGRAYFVARRYAESIEAFMHMTSLDQTQHAFLAACYARLGDRTAADAHVARIHELDPGFELDAHLATMHYKRDEDLAHYRDSLLEAGLPPSRLA